MDEMLYRMVQDSTVRVVTRDPAHGTGCFVAPGLVLTCDYVVAKDNPSRVIWRDAEYVSRISAMSQSEDSNGLALLQIQDPPSAHQCVYLHDSIRPGDILYSFGFPADFRGGDSSRFECEGLSIGPTSIKFKGGQVAIGLAGAPLLNERTGGVCGIINRTRSCEADLGGRAIPVASVFSAFPRLRDLQLTYHRDHNHWLRLLGTAEDYDKSLKLGNVLIPPGYNKLIEPLETFLGDSARECTNYFRNVFIMTRFQPGNKTLETIDTTIRAALRSRGLVGHRADDRCYPTDRNLWDNVCTYMIGCKYGVAVLENILQDEFNPNVALEYGFMRALGKPTLLLKEKRMAPRADIIGTLLEQFDILNIETTITHAINRWADDCGI
jgi:hypothetical protein